MASQFNALQGNLAFAPIAALPFLERLTGDPGTDLAMASAGPLAAAEFLRRRQPHPTDPGRSKDGKYMGADNIARDREAQGLEEIRNQRASGPLLDDRQVEVKLFDPAAGTQRRRYDAIEIMGVDKDGALLARGWEVKPSESAKIRRQIDFDDRVSIRTPAEGVYNGAESNYHGRRIRVVQVQYYYVR